MFLQKFFHDSTIGCNGLDTHRIINQLLFMRAGLPPSWEDWTSTIPGVMGISPSDLNLTKFINSWTIRWAVCRIMFSKSITNYYKFYAKLFSISWTIIENVIYHSNFHSQIPIKNDNNFDEFFNLAITAIFRLCAPRVKNKYSMIASPALLFK